MSCSGTRCCGDDCQSQEYAISSETIDSNFTITPQDFTDTPVSNNTIEHVELAKEQNYGNVKARKTQRVPKSCKSCARKKIKCDKVIPCKPCIERGEAHLCAREVVLVKGLIHNMESVIDSNISPEFVNKMKRLEKENSDLLRQVSSLQQLVIKLQQANKNHAKQSSAYEFSSPSDSGVSPESTVNNYANALQYLTIGIIDDNETNKDPVQQKKNRYSLDENAIPAFSRKPLEQKDIKPSCPSCSIGEISHCFAARLPFADISDQKILLSLAFDLPDITRFQSTKIIQYSLDCLNFLHNALHPPSFYLEHDYFWNSNQPKKLTAKYDRVRGQYLWASIWYATMCLGVFYADENLKSNIGFDEKTIKVLPHMLLAASLECLHRGEIYKYPDIRSVQVFCVLSPCFQALAGVNMRNSLLNTVVYISQRLNLDKIDSEEQLDMIKRYDYGDVDSSTRFLDRELGRRIWWSLVCIDWMDNTGRDSVIKAISFTTTIPGNYNDDELIEVTEDENQVQIPSPSPLKSFTVSAFHIYMSKLASIKRRYYFDINSHSVIYENLVSANEELDKLMETLPSPLEISSRKYIFGDITSQTLSWQRFLIQVITDFERLNINRTMSVCVSKTEWNRTCRKTCQKSARSLLMNCSNSLPLVYKKHPAVLGSGIAAAVFLLLDLMDGKSSKKQISERIQWIENFLPVLEDLQLIHSQARRGITIIRKLITGVLINSQESEKSKTGSKKKRQGDEAVESAPSLYEIIQRLTILPKVSTAPPKTTVTNTSRSSTTSYMPSDLTESNISTQSISISEPLAENSVFNTIKTEPPSFSSRVNDSVRQHKVTNINSNQEFGSLDNYLQQSLNQNEHQETLTAFEQYPISHQFSNEIQFDQPQPRPVQSFSNIDKQFIDIDTSAVTFEDLEIMCGLNNQDWETSVGNFNADFDYDNYTLQQPPEDCPDDC